MAIRGSISKNKIQECMLKMFPGSFLCNGDKELRIPCLENGEILQVKCSFICAKDVMDAAEANVVAIADNKDNSFAKFKEPTKEELDEIAELLKELGIPL